MRWRIGAAVIASVLAVVIAGIFSFPEYLDTTVPHFTTEASPPLVSKMVIVVVDGLRNDVATDPALMPSLAKGRAAGSFGIAETAAIPISASFFRAIMVGRLISTLDVLGDFYPYSLTQSSIVHQVHGSGRRVCVISAGPVASAFGAAADVNITLPLSFQYYLANDEAVARSAVEQIETGECSLTIVHFESLDAAGHTTGGASPTYRSSARYVDKMVAEVVAAASPESTMLIVSDHGVADDGSHSIPIKPVREAPFVLWGPGVAAGQIVSIHQIDFAALLAVLLGVPIPPANLGRLPVELLPTHWAASDNGLSRALKQRLEYTREYARSNGRNLPESLDSAATAADPLTSLELVDSFYRNDLAKRTRNVVYAGVLFALIGLSYLCSKLGFERGLWKWLLILWPISIAWATAYPDLFVARGLPAFRPASLLVHPGQSLFFAVALSLLAALLIEVSSRLRQTTWLPALIPLLGLAIFASPSLHDFLFWGAGAVSVGFFVRASLKRTLEVRHVGFVLGILLLLGLRRYRSLSLTLELVAPDFAVPFLMVAAFCVVLWIARSRGRLNRRTIILTCAMFAASAIARSMENASITMAVHTISFAVVLFTLTTRALRNYQVLALGALMASSYLLFDTVAFAELTLALMMIYPICALSGPLDVEWGSVGSALLYFVSAWLLFFNTEHEFDLTAVDTLRKGMHLWSSDQGGAFSVSSVVIMSYLKFGAFFILPFLVIVLTGPSGRDRHWWNRFIATGAALHVHLLAVSFARMMSIGYAASGGIILAASACLVFLFATILHRDENSAHAGSTGAATSIPAMPFSTT